MGGAVAVNRDLQLIRRAYNWALSARPDDVETSPASFKTGKPPKGLFTSERPRGRRLQGDEAERLLRACGTTLRPLVEAALETGCRQGERLLTLQWGEVNLREVKPEYPADGGEDQDPDRPHDPDFSNPPRLADAGNAPIRRQGPAPRR